MDTHPEVPRCLQIVKYLKIVSKIPWKRELGEGVGCQVTDGGVGEEFHDHADILGGGIEHHWREVHCGTEEKYY